MEYELGLYRGMFNYLGVCSFMPWNITDLRTAVEALAGWPVTSRKMNPSVSEMAAGGKYFKSQLFLDGAHNALGHNQHDDDGDNP